MTQDSGEKGSQVDQSTLTQELQVVPKWLRIASGFSRVLPHSCGMVLPEDSPSKDWVQPCEFWIPCESPARAESLCLFSASPEWATGQWWQQPPCKWGEMCREAAAARFQWGRTILWPWVYYFYCFYWNIVCIHTQTWKHIIIVNFGPSFVTSSLPPIKTFLSVCSLAVFADKGYNSGGSIWFCKVSLWTAVQLPVK